MKNYKVRGLLGHNNHYNLYITTNNTIHITSVTINTFMSFSMCQALLKLLYVSKLSNMKYAVIRSISVTKCSHKVSHI